MIGVTSHSFAFIVTIVAVIFAWSVLHALGRFRRVAGSHDYLLGIITTKSGYASLSQLQMILWAFVIGAGAIYVMARSGSLIEIGQGTLILLGISGVATLGSKLQSGMSGASTTSTPPGKVAKLNASVAANLPEVELSWDRPQGGGAVDGYLVELKEGNGAWQTISASLPTPGAKLVGLKEGANYTARVSAGNAAGSSEATETPFATPSTAPSRKDIKWQGTITTTTIDLVWSDFDRNKQKLLVRKHHGKDDWRPAAYKDPRKPGTWRVSGLEPDTLYDFKVIEDAKSSEVYSAATIGPRSPKWSDLIVSASSENEIDVTRLQMLFFTVIVAVFVILRIISAGVIPDIPESYLLLMGISNGVYLTSKFIR